MNPILPGESTTPSNTFNSPRGTIDHPNPTAPRRALGFPREHDADTQSTSSKTKMHSCTATFVASPSTWYRSSKSQSASLVRADLR